MGASLILKPLSHKLTRPNLVLKRHSGHNNIGITPSYFSAYQVRDMFLFYSFIVGVPIAIITTIINIRANPELSEIPEGYEPRHWEYSRHPITRFLARYIFEPNELEWEMLMCMENEKGENLLINKLRRRVEKVMSFYNDHRSYYFTPVFGDYYRRAREESQFLGEYVTSYKNTVHDAAYDPEIRIVPTEGYHIRPET